jgi:uncharacterized protein (DUF2062 family)
MSPEKHIAREERFARLRRLKQFLRFMPRRAMLHKYPVIGRFAAVARRRAYLWSFKPAHIRPALYAGSILSLLPVMGVQLPLAFILSLLLRGNFMVMGGLQFITNPFTAAPIYYATHQLGKYVISVSGFGHSIPATDPIPLSLPSAELAHEDENEPGETVHSTPAPLPSAAARPGVIRWTRRLGTAINALIIGGVLSGAALGLLLDILYRNYWQHHTHVHPPHRRHPRHHKPPPPQPSG